MPKILFKGHGVHYLYGPLSSLQRANILVFLFVLTSVFNTESAQAHVSCPQILNSMQTEQSQNVQQKQTAALNIKTFAQDMTEGMLLHPDQTELFEIYKKIFYKYGPEKNFHTTLKNITELLEKYPNLTKPHFREYEFEVTQKIYDSPEELLKYVKSQIVTAGQIRSNLFQIDANLDYWKKILHYPELPVPIELQKPPQSDSPANIKTTYKLKKMEYKNAQHEDSARFKKIVEQIISKINQDFLADTEGESENYFNKTKALFKTLEQIQKQMEEKGQYTQPIRQAMIDLIHTVGFGNKATQALLKSTNALDKIEGLKKLLDERDSLAVELTAGKHFSELQRDLRIEFPTGLSKNDNPYINIQNFEKQVFASKYIVKTTQTLRARSLSIQEAPFRSCLGNDCSSYSYFDKALDPNYNYFTITDRENHSFGCVTVVLGWAIDQNGNKYQVAFMDKLQNIPNQMILVFLEAVRRSLAEKGYLLVVPHDVGTDMRGITELSAIRHFVANEILAKLTTNTLTDFTPHTHQYKFEDSQLYSRAYLKLPVKPFEVKDLDRSANIRPGKAYVPRLASTELNSRALIEEFIRLKDSAQEQDILNYISGAQFIASLDRMKLYSQNEFKQDLAKFAGDPNRSFEIRRHAFVESLLMQSKLETTLIDFQVAHFSDLERRQLVSEIRQWSKSIDKPRKAFYDLTLSLWFKAAREGSVLILNQLLDSGVIDINQKNQRGYTALTVAVQNNQTGVVDFLLANSKLNILETDSKGFTAMDHALALERPELATRIKEKRSDIKWSESKAVFPHVFQTMDFITVTPDSSWTDKDPIEIMSTHVTQKMYFDIMGKNPAIHIDGENTVVVTTANKVQKLQPDNPIENISYVDGAQFIRKINELSKQDSPLLYQLISDHNRGDQYDFISEAQIRHVAKNAMTEDGDTLDKMVERHDVEKLKRYVLFSDSSGNSTQPVGSKKPLFINGHPIFDVVGHAWIWTKYQNQSLMGDNDSQEPDDNSIIVVHGGSYQFKMDFLHSSMSSYRKMEPTMSREDMGLRLVRRRH